MGEINISFLKKLIDTNLTFEEIERFIEDVSSIKDELMNYLWLRNKKNIPKFEKNRKEIIAFIDTHEEYIKLFDDNGILYEMTTSFNTHYHWEDTYRPILLEIFKFGPEKAKYVLEKIESYNIDNVHFGCFAPNKRYYESIKKKYLRDEYEMELYYTDGEKKYLARYTSDSYPFVLENANILIVIRKNHFFYNANEIYFSSFDIDFSKIVIHENINDILDSIPTDEINKCSKLCEHIRRLDKIIERLEYTKSGLNKIVENEYMADFHKEELEEIKMEIEKYRKKREDTFNYYLLNNPNYTKEFLIKNIHYLDHMEYQSSIHVD